MTAHRLESRSFRAMGTNCAVSVTALPRDANHARREFQPARRRWSHASALYRGLIPPATCAG